MGIPQRLQARLARLEAKVEALPDLEAELEWKTPLELHFLTWATRGSFEDIPEKDRDPEMWEFFCKHGPLFLGDIWKGFEPGREEYLAAGVDFTLADDLPGFHSAPEYGAPGPDTPRKL